MDRRMLDQRREREEMFRKTTPSLSREGQRGQQKQSSDNDQAIPHGRNLPHGRPGPYSTDVSLMA